MPKNFPPKTGLSFDDVMLVPGYAKLHPHEISVKTRITRRIYLSHPLISAAMDTVTENEMAIAMALTGGMGVIHKSMQIGKQVEEVRRVKRFQSNIVEKPITVSPDSPLAEAQDLMKTYKVSALPVAEQPSQEIVGILTRRDIRFVEDEMALVKDRMTTENLITAHGHIDVEQAKELMRVNKIEQIIILDDQNRCSGLITAKDIDHPVNFPNATCDDHGRLRVAAAVGVGKEAYDRASALADAGVDLIVVEAPHGHSKDVIGAVSKIRQLRSSDIQVMAGNVATAEAARALVDVGADAIKVGLGIGSIATTGHHVGVSVPQLSAIADVAAECSLLNIPVIADGGISSSSDIAKAIAAGADCVMSGRLFAGADEAPGMISLYEGQACKLYRGMKSLSALAEKSRDRYGQAVDLSMVSVEGKEDYIPCSGPAEQTINSLLLGFKTAMGYTGCDDIEMMKRDCEFMKVTK